MQKIPSDYQVEFQQLRLLLVAETRKQSLSHATPDVVIAKLRECAEVHLNTGYPPQIQLAMERILLEIQYVYLIAHTESHRLLRSIIERYDEIGYNNLTLWGSLRCHLADMLEANGRRRDARLLRKEVETEYAREAELMESLIFKRIRNHE